jgi:hypothetical protein
MVELREIEERRYGAVTALRAMVECLKDTNPQAIFAQPGKEASALDTTKVQAISNRWADKASDVLIQALSLADRIGADALDMFEGEAHAPGAERKPTP